MMVVGGSGDRCVDEATLRLTQDDISSCQGEKDGVRVEGSLQFRAYFGNP